jgi:glycine oxidase
VSADAFVICCGAWTPRLLDGLRWRVPIEPRRGQLVVWHAPDVPLQVVLNEGLRYIVPRGDGRLLAGATVEDVGYDMNITADGIAQMSKFAASWLPVLQDRQPETAWAGLRPWTPDGLPYMGRLPGWRNAWICAGQFRSGLHRSPAVAVALADALDGNPAGWDLEPFRVAR